MRSLPNPQPDRCTRLPDTPSWTRAIALGHDAEDRLAAALRTRGFRVNFAPRNGTRQPFDLKAIASIEVKHDLEAPNTGRFAIEIRRDGRPVGINTTTADQWCLVAGDEAFLISPAKLRRLVSEAHVVTGGDGSRTELALVRVDFIRRASQVIRLSEEA